MEHNEKDHIQNLQGKEAVDKLRELAEAAKICMLATSVPGKLSKLRPMSPMKVDESGNIWFFSSKTSDKNREIIADSRVQLSFSNMGNSEFLSIDGKADIIIDKEAFKALWSPIAKVWFQGGEDDPDLSLIRVTPSDIYYWDTKHGKMVALLKIAAAMVAGKTMDDGVEGKLSV